MSVAAEVSRGAPGFNESLLACQFNMVGVAKRPKAPDCGSGIRGFESHHPPHEKLRCFRIGVFQLNPPLGVGEILLRNVKSSLRLDEIAAAVGGFNFICAADFIKVLL